MNPETSKKNYTTTIGLQGDLCNQIIRNVAFSLIAEKNDLFVEYAFHKEIEQLGIKLFVGEKLPNACQLIHPNNYLKLLESNKCCKILVGKFFLQRIHIIEKIIEYFNTPFIKGNIILSNPFKQRYEKNNDVFIHMRLRGKVKKAVMKTFDMKFFHKCLSMIEYDNVYIASDSPKDPDLVNLLNKTNGILVEKNRIETIQFGSTCKHVLLSQGSFSATIGYLAFNSDVYYYDVIPTWHPKDLYKIKTWNAITPDMIA